MIQNNYTTPHKELLWHYVLNKANWSIRIWNFLLLQFSSRKLKLFPSLWSYLINSGLFFFILVLVFILTSTYNAALLFSCPYTECILSFFLLNPLSVDVKSEYHSVSFSLIIPAYLRYILFYNKLLSHYFSCMVKTSFIFIFVTECA